MLRSRHMEVFIIIIFHPSQHSSCSYDLEVGFFHSDKSALNKKFLENQTRMLQTASAKVTLLIAPIHKRVWFAI